MLVLDRKPNQEIRIGDNIRIVFLGLNEYGNARIGIDAPKEVKILRAELCEIVDVKSEDT